MNYFLLLLSLACISLNPIVAQVEFPEFVELHPSNYRDDAVQLAARLVQHNHQSEEVPTALIDSIDNILWKVALSDHPKAKIITQQYDIHTFKNVNTHEFYFFVDSTVAWANHLAYTQRLEHSPLNEVIHAYNHIGVSLLEYSSGLYKFKLQAAEPMNMEYFAQQISQLPDILMVEVPAPSGDGNDIQLRRIGTGWIVSYYYKYGNCAYSCDYQYNWHFGVSDAGEVKFMGEYGDVPSGYKPSEHQTADNK